MKIRLLSLLLAMLTFLPIFVGCNQSDSDEAETTTAASETTAKATLTSKPQTSETPLLSTDVGSAGLELMLNIIGDYYMRNNRLKGEPTSSNAASVWGVASFIEALADTYRIAPDNAKVADTYVKALDLCLAEYAVRNATIQTPNGPATVTYYNATAGGKGDYYYDDDAWLCVQFLNAYELLKDEKYLTLAEELLEFFWTGWDDVLGGGIYWDKSYSGKNTCANGPIAISFLWAYQLTEKEEYLEKGKMIYDWTREVLLQDDLYCDSINTTTLELNGWKAAYNQGVMIYAGAQLYEITGDQTYYDQTKATMEKTINLMFTGSGRSARMNGNPIFKSWCIGWLTRGFIKYYTIDPDKDETAMSKLEGVLERELKTKTTAGYYDPYFTTGDWSSESVTDVLQPCGITSVFCLTHYYLTEIKAAS